MTTLINTISKYFTFVVLFIAVSAGLFWLPRDLTHAINAFTAVLIIACPCALALSTPFTLGTALRIFGRNKFYLKNTGVIEALTNIDTIVFDKTGTLTHSGQARIQYHGHPLTDRDQKMIKAITRHSTHPLSTRIFNEWPDIPLQAADFFEELSGQGITGAVDNVPLRVGSFEWVMGIPWPDQNDTPATGRESRVHVKIGSEYKGYFGISNVYRNNFDQIIYSLKKEFRLALLSGDNDREKDHLLQIFAADSELHFNQSPQDKLDFVKNLQQKQKSVMMVGDGLNDAGALKQSNVGIAVTEDISTFSPACDAIFDASGFDKLPKFIRLARKSMTIIKLNFYISFLYNIIGLSFAVSGTLTPIISAILMPISSITVVTIATLATTFHAKRIGLWE